MSEVTHVAVALQWQGAAGQTVELMGDFPNRQHPEPMSEVEPGIYECHLKLPPGLYRYRFRVDQEWHLDPNALCVDRTEEPATSVLIVGGILSPVLFAPDRRHWAQWEDGRIVVHAECSAEATPPAWIHAFGPEPAHAGNASPLAYRAPLQPVLERHQRTLLRAEIRRPITANPWTHLQFDGSPHPPFLLPPPRPPLGQPPFWLRHATLYGIAVDQWRRDLDGITADLDRLKTLGVTGLVLSPLHRAVSPLRRDPVSLVEIDPALGGEEALLRLLDAARQRRMKVVVEVNVTHIHEQHPAFQDVLEQQEASSYASWFFVRDYPVVAGDATTVDHHPQHPDWLWLDLDARDAREHVLQALEQLVEWGVDGLHLRTMEEAPHDFWQELRSRLRHHRPDVLLMGSDSALPFAQLAEHNGLDTALDEAHRDALVDFFARDTLDAPAFWERLVLHQFRQGPFDPSFRLLSLDGLTTQRFLSAASSPRHQRLRLALAYLLFRPEPVWLTYGTEWDLEPPASPDTHEPPVAWLSPMPSSPPKPATTETLLQQMTRWRQSLEPMQHDTLRCREARDRLLVLERVAPHATLLGYFTTHSEPLPCDDLPPPEQLLLAVNDDTPAPDTLAPFSARWYLLPVR